MVKFSQDVTSSRRKCRKAHFTAPSSKRRVIMSASLSKELRKKYNVRAIPVRKDDEVRVVRGSFKDHEGKVVSVYRKRWVIHIDKLVRDKDNGQQVQVGVDPSKVQVTKLKLNNNRNQILARKSNQRADKNKGKVTQSDVSGMTQVD